MAIKLRYYICAVTMPTGTVYQTTEDIDPAELFGGVWEKIEGRFLLASNDTFASGDEGGEETHTLSVDEMPNHSHSYGVYASGGSTLTGFNHIASYASQCPTKGWGSNVGDRGGSQPHNNMPPYVVVNMWKRTAIFPLGGGA